MTSSSTNSTKRGKLLDLPFITSTEEGGGGGGGGLVSIFFWGGLQTQGETMSTF